MNKPLKIILFSLILLAAVIIYIYTINLATHIQSVNGKAETSIKQGGDAIKLGVSFKPSVVRHRWYGQILEEEPKEEVTLNLFKRISVPIYSKGTNYMFFHISFLVFLFIFILFLFSRM